MSENCERVFEFLYFEREYINLFYNPVGFFEFVRISNYLAGRRSNVRLHVTSFASLHSTKNSNYAMKLEPMKEAPWKKDSFIIPFNELALLSFLTSELIA